MLMKSSVQHVTVRPLSSLYTICSDVKCLLPTMGFYERRSAEKVDGLLINKGHPTRTSWNVSTAFLARMSSNSLMAAVKAIGDGAFFLLWAKAVIQPSMNFFAEMMGLWETWLRLHPG